MSKYEGVEIVDVQAGDQILPGISVEIPGIGKNVLQIKCKNGMLLCGLFSPEKINVMGFAACVFSAPGFSNMLENKPLFISEKAAELGATQDMTGAEIAALFSR